MTEIGLDESQNQTVAPGTFWRLMGYLRPHKGRLLVAFLLLGLATAADVLQPILVKIFIDQNLIPRHFPETPLVELGAGYLLLVLLTACFNVLQLYLFQVLALDIIQRLRVDLFDRVQTLALSFFDKTPVGVLVSRITNDTQSILDMFMSVLSTFVQNVAVLIGVMVAMFVLDVRLALYCLALFPVIFAVMWLYQKVTSPVFWATRQRVALINAKLNESLQGMGIIQAMRQEPRLRREFGEINEAHRRVRYRNTQLNGLLTRPLMEVIYLLTLMLVLGFFGLRSFSHVVNIGILYAFVSYLSRFFEPINNMMQRLNFFQTAMVSANRVFQILDNPSRRPMSEGDRAPTITRGEVAFEDVSFSYDGEKDVLEHISFTAKPGQTVALVGHTGSGKSSTINLLMRFYPVNRGRITIDGHDLREFQEEELRQKMGLVLQDPFLFVGDISSNIRLGDTQITDQEVKAAAEFVQADGFIQRLPGGYNAPIGERGATLSTGQRQLISFARTMAHNPTILVLDEATASVDTETEDAIQDALRRMRKGRTTIAIAHRLSTIQDADLILVLHHGKVVERGTHQQLLAERGLYHAMYLLQQGGSEDSA
ncbi:ABC transporter ATP-binding protein [Sulfobacillus harzensis]|uniref:ABC transporter ATP-binding protein n=1 Tax=Sulfobacillus harzensis TaxID=2729629 RepID=A0A7Y0L2P4_9FIRM|nr:ABC transporter ATP-binding protein [Sulfobacillus harzensis]NMP21285.1 ABC transporter ATP-binding protein [Sulfobacillus harzensis]